MVDFDLNFRDYTQPPIQGPLPVENSGATEQTTASTEDSTIEQSQETGFFLILLPNFPVLAAPSSASDDNFDVMATAVFSSDQNNGWGSFLLSQELRMHQIGDDILDSWLENIREMEQLVRELLSSPNYKAQQDIRLHGDPTQGVSGVQSNTEANAAASHPTTALLLANANIFERISPNATVSNPNSPDDPTQLITLPIMAALFIGGALALGAMEVTTSTTGMSSNPLSGPIEILDRFQPLYPHLIQDVLPMINLAVMPLIYFTSWDSCIGNIRNREGDNHIAAAQNFAKEVIKMVSNPAFVMVTFVNSMEGADQLSPERKEQLAAMIKLILASVALSLLYSTEVGKVHDGKFGGITPEEFRDLLSGELPIGNPNDPNLTETQRLELTLLSQIKAQLDVLSPEQRLETIDTLFAYLTETRNVESMLDPTKVFRQVFEGGAANSEVGANALGGARV